MVIMVPLTWLVVGMTVPMTGTVVDGDGREVAGASVWLGDTIATRVGPEVLASAEADDQGAFRLERPDDLAGRGSMWSPTLWAFKPGFRPGSVEFKRKVPGADEPIKIAIGPPASTPVRIVQPDGRPADRARIRPVWKDSRTPRPPDKLLDRLATRADADGRATLDGLAPGDLNGVDVSVEGQVTQWLPIEDDATVTLRATGRLEVRVVADDPQAVAGWSITATIRPIEAGYTGPYKTQWAEETTDAEGRARFPPLAEGRILWSIRPPEGSDYLAAEGPEQAIRSGTPAEVEIAARRGVRVEGTLLEEPGGAPIPGVKFDLAPIRNGSRTIQWPATDAQGHFSRVLPPGKARFRFSHSDMPRDFFLPPGTQDWLDFEVKEGEPRQAISVPPLRRAALVRGRVLDEAGRPVPGADVSSSWTSGEVGQQPNGPQVQADSRGEFVLGGIAPGAEVRVTANLGPATDSEPVTVPSAGAGGPITVRIRNRPTFSLSGRVVGEDGRPLANIPIRIVLRAPGQAMSSGSDFAYDGAEALRTDAEGRYKTPERLPLGYDYSVAVNEPGYEPAASRWVVAKPYTVPDLALRKLVGSREVSGTVADSAGRPLAGVEVFQSGDGPRRVRGLTDAEGRFRISGFPDAPALVFASKQGHRFLGRRVEPGDPALSLALRRLDEPPSALLRAAEPAVPRLEEQAIARALVAEARKATDDQVLFQERSEIPRIAARLDPDRTIALIEDQVIPADAPLLTAIALGRSEGDARKALGFLDEIEGPGSIAEPALELLDRLGSTAPLEVRRGLLERAERAGRGLAGPGQASGLLARTADRWFDLGDPGRGASLAREAQVLAARPREPSFPDPGYDLALALARVDLPASLKLLEGDDSSPNDPINRARAGVAERIAATDPGEAGRLIGRIGPGYSQESARRDVAFRLAASDLPAARALVAQDSDPMVAALLPAFAARGRAGSDPAEARALLLESIERLARLELGDSQQSSLATPPSLAIARLLPLAARIDPDRASGYFWLALSRRPSLGRQPEPKPIMPWHRQHYLDLAELAVLAARHDRAAAEVVFAPVAARLVGLHDDFWGLGSEGPALYRAAGAFDARIALRLFDALPHDPPPPPRQRISMPGSQNHAKGLARVALADILSFAPPLRDRVPQFPQPRNNWFRRLDD